MLGSFPDSGRNPRCGLLRIEMTLLCRSTSERCRNTTSRRRSPEKIATLAMVAKSPTQARSGLGKGRGPGSDWTEACRSSERTGPPLECPRNARRLSSPSQGSIARWVGQLHARAEPRSLILQTVMYTVSRLDTVMQALSGLSNRKRDSMNRPHSLQ